MEKVKKAFNIYIAAAVFLFLAACILLYIIEFVMYAGAIGTVFIYASVYPPLILLLYFAFGRKRPAAETSPERKAAQAVIAYLLLAACTVLMANYVLTGAYTRLSSLQILAALIAFDAVVAAHKLRAKKASIRFKAIAAGIIYAAILLTSVLYILVVKPYTVNSALNKLEIAGYQDASFSSHHSRDADGIPEVTGFLGAYSFHSESAQLTVYFDVVTGEIIK